MSPPPQCRGSLQFDSAAPSSSAEPNPTHHPTPPNPTHGDHTGVGVAGAVHVGDLEAARGDGIAIKKLRIVILGFGTARQKMVLE